MAGLVVFHSVAEALAAGFQIYDRTPDGYLVRKSTEQGWAMALVICKTHVAASCAPRFECGHSAERHCETA